jgi:hypothetical protein
MSRHFGLRIAQGGAVLPPRSATPRRAAAWLRLAERGFGWAAAACALLWLLHQGFSR